MINNELKKKEKLLIENSYNEIIDELFNNKKIIVYDKLNEKNFDTIILKNKKDYEDFGLLCSNKVKKETSFI